MREQGCARKTERFRKSFRDVVESAGSTALVSDQGAAGSGPVATPGKKLPRRQPDGATKPIRPMAGAS